MEQELPPDPNAKKLRALMGVLQWAVDFGDLTYEESMEVYTEVGEKLYKEE